MVVNGERRGFRPNKEKGYIFLALKFCTECGQKRALMDRLFYEDAEMCDECFYKMVREIREKKY
jgi:hypothetical protein